MHFGLLLYPPHSAVDICWFGKAAEDRGFESLFFPEHTHFPVEQTAYHGFDLPPEASDTYDPFVAAAAAASATSRLRLGTGACLVAQRDPIVTAKLVSTIDRISKGRFLFGIGAGWNRAEMQNHGCDPRTRMRHLADNVHAMKEIWANDPAEYHGDFVDFGPIRCDPKPLQRPHPPILVGGHGPTVVDRVLAFGDEWMPQVLPDVSVDQLGARIDALHHAARERRRSVPDVTVIGAGGTNVDVRAYAEIGAARYVFDFAPDDAPEKKLDAMAAVADSCA